MLDPLRTKPQDVFLADPVWSVCRQKNWDKDVLISLPKCYPQTGHRSLTWDCRSAVNAIQNVQNFPKCPKCLKHFPSWIFLVTGARGRAQVLGATEVQELDELDGCSDRIWVHRPIKASQDWHCCFTLYGTCRSAFLLWWLANIGSQDRWQECCSGEHGMKCKDRFAIPAANCDDCALFAVRRARHVARKGRASSVKLQPPSSCKSTNPNVFILYIEEHWKQHCSHCSLCVSVCWQKKWASLERRSRCLPRHRSRKRQLSSRFWVPECTSNGGADASCGGAEAIASSLALPAVGRARVAKS